MNRREFFKTAILSLLAVPLGKFAPRWQMGVDQAIGQYYKIGWKWYGRYGITNNKQKVIYIEPNTED